MMDFGFAELFIIIALAVLLIGPAELPNVMRGLGRIVKRLQYMKYAISRQFDDLMYDQEVDMMQSEAKDKTTGDIETEKEADRDQS